MFRFSEARESIYIFVFFAHIGAQRRKDEEGRLEAAVLKVIIVVGELMSRAQRLGVWV